jgi:acetyl esterase/lipase
MPSSAGETPPTWLQAMRDMDPATEAMPGVTIAQMLALHDHLDAPPGSVHHPAERYAEVDGVPLHLSLYRRADTSERRPGVVFIHGGGWAGGCATFHARQCAALAEQGYVTAAIDYRVAPAVRWPDPLLDCKRAVRWLRANHGRFGLDPERIVVAGGSAGGHLAAMVALTPGRWEPDDAPAVSSAVCGAVLWYPCVDMAGLLAHPDAPPMVEAFLGSLDESLLREASPLTHVHGGAPPVLTMTGSVDPLTTVADIRHFHAALDAHGVTNRLRVFEAADHGFDFYPDGWEAGFAEMSGFLGELVGAPAVAG